MSETISNATGLDSVKVDRGKGVENNSHVPGVVITYPFPLGEASGGARMTREIARHLSRLGADVVVLPVSTNALDRRYPRSEVDEKVLGFEFDEDLARDAIDVVRVQQHPLHYQLDGFSVKKALRSILKERTVDIVLSYFHEAAFLPSFLRTQGIKFGYIATWITYAGLARKHAQGAGGWVQNWKNNRMIVEPYKHADIIFATSSHTRNELMDIIGVDGGRIVVCYLGVDPVFTKIPRTPPTEITRFLFFGRVIPRKGFFDALEALGKLAASGYKNWTFRIVGNGRSEWARQAARDHGIADKVTVCDAVGDEGLRQELEQAHVAIMPSYAESFGLAFAEAQAAGLPVVAYARGSVPEVVENGVTGWLAPYRKVDQLAQCIIKAISDPEATYQAGLMGRKRVQRMFTWEKTAVTILEGIRTVTESCPC